MRTNRRNVAIGVLMGAIAVVVGAAVAPAWSQPRRVSKPDTELTVPAGQYSAIVFSAFGTSSGTSIAAYITTGDGEAGRRRDLPVIVRGGESLVLPFAGGWTIGAGDRVRIVVSPDAPTDALRIWGIGPSGPVSFVESTGGRP